MAFYTCTLNLAIDLFIETDELKPFVVNRTKDDDIQANGKGVNVSLILKLLGIDSTALGFQAGFTGNHIEDFLQDKQINTGFIEVPGLTRINVFTQVNETKEEYKLVNKGPTIPDEAIQSLLNQINQLQAGDYLCISGSFPQGVSSSILVDIAQICYKRKVHLVIDNSSLAVMDCLTYQPFLLKPNEEELALWFGKKIHTREEYIFYGKELLKQGAENVLISLGAEGAILLNKEGIFSGNSPKGKVVNTACSGDTLLGTFMAGILNGKNMEENLKHSLAAGSSTAFRKGLTDFSDVDDLQTQITIQKEE
ncbi:1-phosphofructokinase [Tetragenococcus koreensis]|uniref:1-phosphofructokinase n=1 Tax=Tetragenococcus koreensis TaxID=290335 RepID=UPI000F5128AC|nr:1-phosphofructokinase [Tetragenococcus koreensis]AYW44780.1 1-phosphofructokinase [Tetragenococcus koreensis]MCF1631871.1 1-phosphofructokinase [Tetragenococcus koreensis]GEN92136.1 tagatose-6-phosphate kinase [Tetragenococcus koreensis]